MNKTAATSDLDPVVDVINPNGLNEVVLVCEHASAVIPCIFNYLGLGKQAAASHIAWDLGALDTARAMSRHLDAVLVAGCVSRLVYDCNRPPEASSAMPEVSEVYAIPAIRTCLIAQGAHVLKPTTDPLSEPLVKHFRAG